MASTKITKGIFFKKRIVKLRAIEIILISSNVSLIRVSVCKNIENREKHIKVIKTEKFPEQLKESTLILQKNKKKSTPGLMAVKL